MGDTERPGSLLTPTQREFLKNPTEYYSGEYAKQQRYERRESVKERVWYGLLDGTLLYEETSADERRAMFDAWREFSDPVEVPADERRYDDRLEPDDVAESRGEFVEKLRADVAFRSWVAFLYLGLTESDEYDFESVLRAGVEDAERSRGRVATDVEFNVTTRERRDLDELQELFERRATLTSDEIQRLRAEGVVSDEELGTYFDERPTPDVDA
jgi:hypothetical protein